MDLIIFFYGTSKIGLEAATRSLAREGARYNVLVNALRPGITDTEFYSNIGKNISERVLMIPLKRAAKPIEIANCRSKLIARNGLGWG